MADYRNYFDKDNPLSLYNTTPSYVNPNSNTQPIWQTKEFQDDLRWQKVLEGRKARAPKPTLLEEVSKKYVENMSNALGSGLTITDDLYTDAVLRTLLKTDLETGEPMFPILRDMEETYANIKDVLLEKNYYDNLSKDVVNLTKDWNLFSKTRKSTLSDYKNEVLNMAVLLGNVKSKEEGEELWNSLSEDAKSTSVVNTIGRKYFSYDLNKLDKFRSLDTAGKVAMLAAISKNNPFYQSENAKYKKQLDKDHWEYLGGIFGGIKNTFESLHNWGEKQLEVSEDMPLEGIGHKVIGGAASILGSFEKEVAEALHKEHVAVIGELTNGEEEKIDNTIAEFDKAFIKLESDERKLRYLNASPEERKALVDRFDELSKSSATYLKAKDTSLTKLLPDTASKKEEDDVKLNKLAELDTKAELLGEWAKYNGIDEFWKNTTASNQTALDYIGNTSGQFIASLGSDVFSSLAILTNIVNPYTLGISGEDDNNIGYSDALINHNVLMDIAEGIQKYSEDHLQTYKSVEDEDSFISWRDIPDIIGQYGYTAASMYISMGGSAAVRWGSKYAAEKALLGTLLNFNPTGVRSFLKQSAGLAVGNLARSRAGIRNRELRELIQAGLKAKKGTEEYTKALEAINQVLAKKMYNLNLAVGAFVGTAEGGLEAVQTYDKFKQDNSLDLRFDALRSRIENASYDELEQYMKASGYLPEEYSLIADGVYGSHYSLEQYELARQELLQRNEELRKLANDRVEDDALDAAFLNFTANSMINGVLNVLVKESLLSKDVRDAARNYKRQTKNILNNIDVVDTSKGWEARIKDAVKATKKSTWKKIQDGVKNPYKVVKEAVKTSGGEFAEEFSQNVSDELSRAALLGDLNNYLEVLYDPDSHAAFNTDFMSIINSGLDAIDTTVANKEAVKAGVFGFLSSMGGVNQAKLLTGTVNAIRNSSSEERFSKQWWKDNLKNTRRIFTGIFDGAITRAYRESEEEGKSTQKLIENINEWLNRKDSQDLLTHLGGAIGFKKTLENALITGNELEAHDSKFALAIENAFMLRALKGTQMEKAYQQSIEDQAALGLIVELENAFDDTGKYIGEDKLAKSAIEAFKELYNKDKINLSDKQILERVSLNAIEFKQLQNEIELAADKILEIYSEDNIDPIVLAAYVSAMLQQKKLHERRDNLKKALDVFNSNIEGLEEADKVAIEEAKKTKSKLNKATVGLLAEYGSIEKAEKELEDLNKQINSLEVDITDAEKKSKKQKADEQDSSAKDLKLQLAFYKMQANSLSARVNAARRDIENNLDTEEESKQKPIFTIGDMIEMSPFDISNILKNKSKYTLELQEEIDKYVKLHLLLLGRKNGDVNDISLTKEELLKLYEDLSILNNKDDAYDSHLRTYIANPQFLSSLALSLKEKQRKKTILFYYKDALTLRPNETVLEMLDRVQEKINMLKDLDNYEDASILESLVNENPVFKNITEAKEITTARIPSVLLSDEEWKGKEDRINTALTGLLSIVSSSGMSVKEVLKLLDALDSDRLKNELLKKYNGLYLLNNKLGKELLKDDANNDEVILPLIEDIKLILAAYNNAAEADKSLGKPLKITPKVETQTKREKAKHTVTESLNRLQLPVESSTIKVTTPGEISGQNSDIKNYLELVGASNHLASMAKPDRVKVAVKSIGGKPYILVVVESPKGPITDANGNALTFPVTKTVNRQILTTYYRVIGYIDTSTTTSSSLEKAAKGAEENIKLLQYDNGEDITLEVNKFDNAKFVSDVAKDSTLPPSLLELLKSSNNIDNWVDDFINRGSAKDEETNVGGETVKKFQIRSHLTFPVGVKKVVPTDNPNGKPLTISLFDITLKDLKIDDKILPETTLKEFLESGYTVELKIKALEKHDSFFKIFFDTWKEYGNNKANRTTWSARVVYDNLLGNFIFLNHIDNLGLADKDKPFSDNRETLSINDKNGKKISFVIPNFITDTDPKILAFTALTLILNNLNNFEYHNPTINTYAISDNLKRKIPNISDNVIKQVKDQEREILKGLIQLDLLLAHTADSATRNIILLNPFASKHLNVKTGNPNLATPDNSKPEAQKENLRAKVEREFTEEQKRKREEAEKFVNQIKEDSKKINLPETNNDDSDEAGYYEHENGAKFARVTSTEEADTRKQLLPILSTPKAKVLSTSFGNTLDAVGRKLVEFLNSLSVLYGADNKDDIDMLYAKLLSMEEFSEGKIPNFSKDLITPWIKQIVKFYNICYDKGWTIVPEGIKAHGFIDVLDAANNKMGVLPTAGTLDFLLYDENGEFFTVDMKTTKNAVYVKPNVEGRWEIQVGDYLYLLLQTYQGMPFRGTNYIFATKLSYAIPTGEVSRGADKMTVLDAVSQKPLDFIITEEPKVIEDDKYEFGMLIPIPYDSATPPSLRHDKLTLEQKDLIMPIEPAVTGSNSNLPGTTQPEGTMAPEKPTFTADDEDDISNFLEKDDDETPKQSRRSIQKAQFVDFINNHITPIRNIKLNVFGKIKQALENMIISREVLLSLMLKDLANTFFLGNTVQLSNVIGNIKITKANMPTIINKLQRYFKTYINNEGKFIAGIEKRQKAYKLLYDFLNDTVSDLKLLEELYNLDIEAKDLPDLIEYYSAKDKELAKKRILLKLLNSAVHTELDALNSILMVLKRIENMRTKLEFLTVSTAAEMLNKRMESIKNTIDRKRYTQVTLNNNVNSMNLLLEGKKETYGTENLLQYITAHSKNAVFRDLAQTLNAYIKQHGIFITVSLEDLLLDIEGESKGKSITIYKSSLDSYEHLERVLLHEILHSVLLVSPKIRDKLTAIIDRTISNMARNSGKTIAEIKKEYYGLTNADEFISEFFTNYAFLEMLRTVLDLKDNMNMTDKILQRVLSIFGIHNSMYDSAYRAIKLIMEYNNFESLTRTAKKVEPFSYVRHTFSALDSDIASMIKARGITEEEFNNMTAFEQDHLLECCK